MSTLPEWLKGPDFSEPEPPQTPKAGNPLEVYNSRKHKRVDEMKVLRANEETAQAVERGEVVIGGSK